MELGNRCEQIIIDCGSRLRAFIDYLVSYLFDPKESSLVG